MSNIHHKNAERVAILGLALAVIGCILMFVTSGCSFSSAAYIEALHLLVCVLIWAITWLHLRTIRVAEDEHLALTEAERQRLSEGRERLFSANADTSGSAQQRLKEMNRYGTVIAAIMIIIVQLTAGGLYLFALIKRTNSPDFANSLGLSLGEELENTSLAVAFSFSIAFFCFILGKYAAGMSRIKGLHLLQAGAGYMIGNAIICLLASASYLAAYYGWLWGDTIITWVIAVLLLILALEMLLNLILDFYRPRIIGEITRPVYGSRVTGLLAEPQGVFHTFANTMDYQFGFSVSDTWFFKFLNRAVAPLILFQLATLYLLTCLVVVNPGEVAVIERWGRPRGVSALPAAPQAQDSVLVRQEKEAAWDLLEPPLLPGLHFKLPWPIETVQTIASDQVQEIIIGTSHSDNQSENKNQEVQGNVVSWDTVHNKDEFQYIMPLVNNTGNTGLNSAAENDKAGDPDVMFVSGLISIQYAIGRPQDLDNPNIFYPGDVYRYLYRHINPKETLVTIGEREVTCYLARARFWDVLVNKITYTETELTRRIQKAADKAGLGVRIILVSLANIHPPAGDVGKSYQEVVAAKEERETKILHARASAANDKARAPGDAAKINFAAEGYAAERELTSKAMADRFLNQVKAYRVAPEIYLQRKRMAAIEDALGKARRIILVPAGVTAVVDDKQDITSGTVGKALLGEMKQY